MGKTNGSKKTVRIRETCRHRWLLETPNGPKVKGRCRSCGMERSFQTVPEEVRIFRPLVKSGDAGSKSGSRIDLDAA